VVELLRRLGTTPQQRGSLNNGTCPDIFETDDGRFAVIGDDLTEELQGLLPADARADGARIVVVTRETLVHARRDIPAGPGRTIISPTIRPVLYSILLLALALTVL
jgi:hypothetical protein